jgi:PII-like signaling protein
MSNEEPAVRVSIHVGESDRWHHRPLHTALVEALNAAGVAGATVLRGVEGYGRSSQMHTATILTLSEDLPLIVTFIDSAETVDRVMPILDDMVPGGLIVLEDVRVRRSGS